MPGPAVVVPKQETFTVGRDGISVQATTGNAMRVVSNIRCRLHQLAGLRIFSYQAIQRQIAPDLNLAARCWVLQHQRGSKGTG